MCNSESPSNSNGPAMMQNIGSSNPNDPQIADVLKTLRILSHASLARRNAIRKGHQGHGGRCPNCNTTMSTASRGTGPRSREEILRNLNQLEMSLQAKGEKLPCWLLAYKAGDSLKAAKLLHAGYLSRTTSKMTNGPEITRTATKRPVEVAPATSTTVIETGTLDSNSSAGENKRRRQSSIDQ